MKTTRANYFRQFEKGVSMSIRLGVTLLCMLTFAMTSVRAQSAYGAFGGMSLNSSTANFEQLEGYVNCNSIFRDGRGYGPVGGLYYERTIVGPLSFLVSGTYRQANNTLTSQEFTSIGVDGVQTDARIDHTVDASIGIVGIQPSLQVTVLGALALHAGIEAGYALQSKFEQRETLEEPADVGAFGSGSRTRNEQSGDIPNANKFIMSMSAGLRYFLPVNATNTLQLVPEISYRQAITPVAKNLVWSISSFSAGVGIRVVIPKAPRTAPPPPPPPPPVLEPPVARLPEVVRPPVVTAPVPTPTVLTSSIRAMGVDEAGTESPVAQLRIEEVASTKIIPMLPYVFFEPNSTTLPSRYTTKAQREDALGINRSMLFEVASRMRSTPGSYLNVIGMTLSKSPSVSDRTASERAAAVVAFLHNEGGIDASRLRATTRPLLPSNTPSLDDVDGVEEINRIELSASESSGLLDPIRIHDTIRTATPPIIRLHTTVQSSDDIVRWEIQTLQKGRGLRTFKGLGAPPESTDWMLAAAQESMPQVPGVVDVVLTVTTAKGESVSRSSINVEQLTLQRKKREHVADKDVEEFNILLFDIGSAELTTAQRNIIESEIKPRIKENSNVTIVGHTDRMGDASANAALSLARAKNTATILGVSKATVRGEGESNVRFDNTTPEARCLSRTVEIRIETPIETP